MKIDPYLSPYTKFKSKYIKDLNIKLDILHLLEENVGKSLKHTSTGRNFLNRIPVAQVLTSKIDKWDLMKLKSFYKAKDTVNQTNWHHTGKKSSLNPPSHRGLMYKIQKNFKKLTFRKPHIRIKNGEQS